MPADGHLSWEAKYKPGKVVATGYIKGKKVLTETIQTTGPAVKAVASTETVGDITIVNVELQDKKGRFVPDARQDVTLTIDSGRIIGAGNGDPACPVIAGPHPVIAGPDRQSIPAFNGRAQFIVQGDPGTINVNI